MDTVEASTNEIDTRSNPEETISPREVIVDKSNEKESNAQNGTNNNHVEDPRLRATNAQRKVQKSSGQGRNTESFDPRSTLVRPDLRVIIGKPTEPKWGKVLKHDDVVVVPNFLCDEDDWSFYNQLIHEMREIQERHVKDSQWISWHEGAHLISKNPQESKTFQMIQKKISDYFSIKNDSVGTRFNWYRDCADWKPFHHDSAAFNPQRARNQNITVGVSFGVTRELAFLHAKNNTKIYFPQTNGMMFSFGRDVNIQWKHGVNYTTEEEQKEEQERFKMKVDVDVTVGRISIILWGLCPHVLDEANSPPMLTDNTRGNGHHMHRNDDRRDQRDQRNRGYEHDRQRDGGDRDRERDRDRPRGRSSSRSRGPPPSSHQGGKRGGDERRSRSRDHQYQRDNRDGRDNRDQRNNNNGNNHNQRNHNNYQNNHNNNNNNNHNAHRPLATSRY